MIDLNDLRVFEQVASLRSFSEAARLLRSPKSSVSRSIARLEAALGTRLFQRTTREVVLTPAGEALWTRCRKGLAELDEAIGHVSDLTAHPRGLLRISAGIGFGINVLADQLPEFLLRFPDVRINLDLTGQIANLVTDGVDVAIRLGPLPDSSLVAVHLGTMPRYLCAAPAYLDRCGTPRLLSEIAAHDVIEMPGTDGRERSWLFARDGKETRIGLRPRACVNDALTIHRMVVNGAGLGVISGYLCGPDIASGRLVRLFQDWSLPAVEINLVFPSKRALTPAVRAFVDFMKSVNPPGEIWKSDPLTAIAPSEIQPD